MKIPLIETKGNMQAVCELGLVVMKEMTINSELLEFIRKSASMYHTVETASKYLDQAGFTELKEGRNWDVHNGGKYYVKRNNSSIIAFAIPSKCGKTYFKIIASHSDSPTFAIKDIAQLSGPEGYIRLNVEAYGGMIDYTWLDRPLGIAGRVMVRTDRGIESRLINIDKDILIIPSQCIHFNRDVNKGMEFNRQADLCPVFTAGDMSKEDFDKMIAHAAGANAADIMGRNIFLVNHQQGVVWGAADEFISSPKLDDLQCAFTSLKAFIATNGCVRINEAAAIETAKSGSESLQSNDCRSIGGAHQGINVYACFDNEEVGSGTKQGALSTFLADTLKRIIMNLGLSQEDYYAAVADSFMISADNAHALHPNHPEKTDECNRPLLNHGIVIKENAAQKYVTDAFSRSIFKSICEKAAVPYQSFANKSNVAGGSTLGNLSNTQVSMHAVDIGLAQLAMHSSYETAGARDSEYAVRAFETFYESEIIIDGADRCQVL